MSLRRMYSVRWLAAAVLLLAGTPAFAAGFGIFEQGTKAMGMAGAFTAQADDPSMLWHNAGGLAFVTQSAGAVGTTWFHSTTADLQGANPFPGDGYSAEQKKLSIFLPHAYYVSPINQTWKWGIGVEAPFGLTTEWKNPDQFAGRFLSTKAALRAVDLNPTLGWQVTPNLGIGFGAIARFSDIELRRNVPFNNPFTQSTIDIARLKLSSGFERGYGWNLGILHKVNPSFSWGLSYRSKVKIDYDGEARLNRIPTGNAQLDAVLGSRLPFDTNLPVSTKIEFPDEASLGLAFGVTPNILVETDVNWTGWSTFNEVPIDFTGDATHSLPDTAIPEHWQDAMNYRVGVRWNCGSDHQLRFGYVFDETPQPEEAISPLLPDANRNGLTVGYGKTGPGLKWDVALMYLKFDERTRGVSFEGDESGPFFGNYNTTAVLLAGTIGW